MAFDHKKDIMSQQFSAMAPKMFRIKYSPEMIIDAFIYATSCSLYNKLREDFQLAIIVKKTKNFKT